MDPNPKYVLHGGRQSRTGVTLEELRRRPGETVEEQRARRAALMEPQAHPDELSADEVADFAKPIPDTIPEEHDDAA